VPANKLATDLADVVRAIARHEAKLRRRADKHDGLGPPSKRRTVVYVADARRRDA